MKTGHTYNINNSRYIKTLGPVVSVATDNALAPAEQVVDDTFKYKKGSTLEWNRDNVPGANDDQSQYLINRILRDHLLNVEAGNFSGDVTIGGDLTVNGDYVNLPVATTTKYGITRLASGTTDPDNNDVVTVSMLNAVKDLLMGPGNTPALDTILELAEAIGDPEQAQSILGRLTHLEECCEEVQELLKKKYTVTYDFNLYWPQTGLSSTYPKSTNDVTEVNEGESFSTTIYPEHIQYPSANGNVFAYFKVTMGGEDITSDVVTTTDNKHYNINIDSVDGDIYITVTGSCVYSVTKTVATSGIGEFVPEGVEYYYSGEYLLTKFNITDPTYANPQEYFPNIMIGSSNGTQLDVTRNGNNLELSGYIYSNVTWNISFVHLIRNNKYSLTKNINPLHIDTVQEVGNSAGELTAGTTYSITVSPKSGYRITSMTLQHNGTTYTASSDYSLEVQSGAGPIVVTVLDEEIPPQTYTITKSATNATITGADSIQQGSSYKATVAAEEGYTVSKSDITVKNSQNQDVPFTYKNGRITISKVQDNLTITVTAQQEEVIDNALKNVSSVEIHEGSQDFRGETDRHLSYKNGQQVVVVPNTYTSRVVNGANTYGYGVFNGDNTHHFKYGKYHTGTVYSDSNYSTIRIQLKSGSGYESVYDAMDYVFHQIDLYNDNIAQCDDYKVCYSSSNTGSEATIHLYPFKYNPGEKRTIAVPLNIPSTIQTSYDSGNRHVPDSGAYAYVNQDKSRAIYEIVDENDNVIPFEFGNGNFAQQAGIGNSATAKMSNEQFADIFGWNCEGNFGIKTPGTYTFKLRIFGIADRPPVGTTEAYLDGYAGVKDMYRYILGDVNQETGDVTPFQWNVTPGNLYSSSGYTPYAIITGTGVDNAFEQTTGSDQGGDQMYIWGEEERTYMYPTGGTFSAGNYVEIPFVVTLTAPESGTNYDRPAAIRCKIQGIDRNGNSDKVYAPYMEQGVYFAQPLVYNYDKTQIQLGARNEISDQMVQNGQEFSVDFYPKSGYSITDVTVAYNGNPPQTVATQTVNINPVEGPIEITITSAAA